MIGRNALSTAPWAESRTSLHGREPRGLGEITQQNSSMSASTAGRCSALVIVSGPAVSPPRSPALHPAPAHPGVGDHYSQEPGQDLRPPRHRPAPVICSRTDLCGALPCHQSGGLLNARSPPATSSWTRSSPPGSPCSATLPQLPLFCDS